MSGKFTKKGKNPGAVDPWLDKLGLYRKNVAYDETCLFRAISEQLFDCQFYHERVRKDCIDYGRKNHHQFKHLEKDERKWNEHLDMLVKHMAVCGTIEIHIIAMKYNRDVIVFDALHQDVIEVTKKDLPDPLLLCLMDEDHYDAVYQKDFIETAGFCQAIVYKLLYQDLFGIPNVDDIVNSMLYDKTSVSTTEMNDSKKEINNNDTSSGDETELSPEVSVSTNIAPFPFKVAKALDPTIYRNIEYDSWGEVRRELRLGDWYYGDDKLILGTRCVLTDSLRNEKHDCYIQEIIKDKNKCVVYLTKLAEKRTVNYADLSPENDAKPWPLPYRFSKNLVIAAPSPITEKVTRSNMKKRNKDKRRTKSCGENSIMIEAGGNVEGAENVNPYVGIPLQMHNPNDAAYRQQTSETNCKTEAADVQATSEVTQETQNNNNSYQQWEPPQWQPYLTPTPDPYVWPQTPTTPLNMFNFAVKPMVASAPVTPDVISFYDPNYHYYYNYSPYPVDPNVNYTQWMTPTPEYTTPQPPPQEIPQTTEETNKNCKTPNSVEVSHPYVPNQSETSEAPSHPERPTLCLQPPTTYHEVYSPMIPLAPGTPVIYTNPEMTEMMMPTTPITVFTPPVDVQYIQPAPFVYPPTPPSAWYPSSINSQGFIFPTMMNAPNIPK